MRWVLVLCLLSSACMLETSRYSRAADVSSAAAKREAVSRFEAEHALTKLHRRAHSAPRPKLEGRLQWKLGETIGDVGDRVVFESRAPEPTNDECWNGARLPSYRYYRATDGHYVVLRLVPDLQRRPVRTIGSMLEKVFPPPLTSPGPCGFERAHYQRVVLGRGEPSSVEVIEAHYSRWVVMLR